MSAGDAARGRDVGFRPGRPESSRRKLPGARPMMIRREDYPVRTFYIPILSLDPQIQSYQGPSEKSKRQR